VFVHNKFRGLGVSNKLILEQIKATIENGQQVTKVQIQLAGSNQPALNSYQKLGFRTVVTKKCDDPKILDLLPSDTKIMMELTIEELIANGLLNLEQ
jgi:predicted GNAT family N-acyltransferase